MVKAYLVALLLLMLLGCSAEPVPIEEIHDAITGHYEGVFRQFTPMTQIIIEQVMVAVIRRFGDNYTLSLKPLDSPHEPRVIDCELEEAIMTCSYAVELVFATTISGVIADGQWSGTIMSTARGPQGTFLFTRLSSA